jgi:archaemetzincin
MKVLISLLVLFALPACNETGKPSMASKTIIAIQPLGNFDKATLQYLSEEIKNFYNYRVIILPEKNIPSAFFNNTKSPRYSADSLLIYLKQEARDSINYVLGITHEDIFTTKKDEKGNIKQPAEKYAVWGIMGLGYQPGKSCIVSDFRLYTNDVLLEQQRLRNVTLHELGHNFGLPHCSNKFCIMTDANESIKTIDNESNTLCESCRKKISDKINLAQFQ